MSVSSVNDHIKPPKGAALLTAGPREGWFVITYQMLAPSGRPEAVVEIFYNQNGREVFRTMRQIKRSLLDKITEGIFYANSNPAPEL